MAYPSDLVRTKDWGTEILTDSALEGQLDLIINWAMASLDSSTGHAHEGTSNKAPKINLSNIDVTSGVAGDVFYHDGSNIVRLAKDEDKYLKSGASAVSWDTPTGAMVQVVNTQTGEVVTGSGTIPNDDTIPQITEGSEYMTLAITPTSATNKLKIDVVFCYTTNDATDNNANAVALFQDSTANALCTVGTFPSYGIAGIFNIAFTHYMTAGTTNETTFKVRAGVDATGTLTMNGVNGARKYGGSYASSITITEIAV